VHRDVKPANMLLGSDRVLHLADFGIASLSTEQTLSRTGQLMGTAAYLSPEQALGRPATAASDRYALAVAAFELLTGERPYPAENFAAQARAHIEDPPPPASVTAGLPDAVDAVMARGLAKEPAERWPTAQSFARALREAVGERAPRLAGLGAASVEAFIGARHRSRAARARAAAAAPGFHARGAAASAPLFGVRGGSAASPALREPPPQVIFESIASAGIGRRHGRGLALAALALVALACGVVVGSSGSGPGASHAAGSALRAGRVTSPATPRQAARPRTPARPRPAAHGITRPAAPAPPTTTTPTATPPSDAATLEAQGHQLMTGGSYSAALPVLRQAVANAEPGTLTYAYALYDLGRTLRLAGDPQAAIPVLEARLRIPNQPAVVAEELNLAERQAGVPAARPLPPSGGAGLPGRHGAGAGPDAGARPSDGPGAGHGPGVRRHSSADLSRSI
jgi:serine/threonine-protein kinase